MEKERVLKLLQAMADNTKTLADGVARQNGFEKAVDIPYGQKEFAILLLDRWSVTNDIMRIMTDAEYAEDIYKIYLPEDKTK